MTERSIAVNIQLNPQLKEKTQESLSAVLPITFIVLALSIFVVPVNVGTMFIFLMGAVLLILGMGMFQLGAEMSMSPLGEGIGIQVAKAKNKSLAALLGFLMGFLVTIAEPDLQVLAEQVPSIPNLTLILTVAVGVGIFLALAVLRIVLKIDLSILLMLLYGVVLVLSFFVPRDFLAVAFDSGGVTTGPMTVPFIMALGVGLSSMRSDKNAASDSFGLVALSSVGPILAVMILGCFFQTGEAEMSLTQIPQVDTVRDVTQSFVHRLPDFAEEVMISILPILGVFVLFQLLTRRYHRRQFWKVSVGFGYTFIGLVLFLCGVNVGFAPVGASLGSELAASEQNWMLIPVGMLIGYFIVKAEPAIQILNKQVQSVTGGVISARAMNLSLSVGVACSIGLAMLRILLGIPLQWIIIPGYLVALIMSRFVPKIFVGIAFDSGGVASGPMTSTFLLPLCIGVCTSLGGDIMTDAFGVVSLVAMTPLIAIQIMGILYRIKTGKQQKQITPVSLIPDDCDEIIEIEEDWNS